MKRYKPITSASAAGMDTYNICTTSPCIRPLYAIKSGVVLADGVRDGGEVVRPQGGGGVDHPKQVQQNKAQTDTRFFSTPGVLVTLKKVCYPNYSKVNMELVKDRKGMSYILSHVRCGYHESIFLTSSELLELELMIKDLKLR